MVLLLTKVGAGMVASNVAKSGSRLSESGCSPSLGIVVDARPEMALV